MVKKIIIIITVISLCLLAVLLNTTTPTVAGPFGILAIFVFAYLSLLGVVTYFIYGASRLSYRLSKLFMFRKPLELLTIKKSLYFSTIISAAPIMLIGFQSVMVVGVYELLLVAFFVVVGCIYVSKKIR
jgi:hypothetical protein